MLKNPVREIWAQGRPVLHGWLSIGNSFTAEIMAAQGYDAISIDVQHGALDYGSVLPMFQAMRASGVALGARVPWNEPGIVMKMLDAGAMQVICPMVNTAEEAARFASTVRYPPRGQRSFGPTRAAFALGPGISEESNDQIVAWAMVETRQALDNIDAILATDGIDGVYIGPADLTFSLHEGRLAPGFDREEPEMVEVLHRIVAAAKSAGKRAALHCGTPDYAAKAVGWGYDMTTVSGDSRLLAAAAAASVAAFRKATSATTPAGTEGGY